jgi:decaprenylphospho-beta-D-erythro-pentofuranosid-2-ulose 2-reductase
MQKTLVLGATSAIAIEYCRLLASQGASLVLVARNQERLNVLKSDLLVRGASSVETLQSDLADISLHAQLITTVLTRHADLSSVLIAYGILGDQKEAERDFAVARQILDVNFTSVVSLLTPLANHFEKLARGSIIVISSVAGDRGRQSNYLYGSSKAALSAYLQGLRNRLSRSNVQVLTVKPGFVDTPMTAAFKKGPLFVGPEVIARGIHRAVSKGRNEVYLPWFWFPIMQVIKSIPEPLFKRMKL